MPTTASLDTQREICKTLRSGPAREGLGEVNVYEDAGFSGKDLDRPAMHRLLFRRQPGQAEHRGHLQLDRISRSLKDFYGFWEVIKKRRGVNSSLATQNFGQPPTPRAT